MAKKKKKEIDESIDLDLEKNKREVNYDNIPYSERGEGIFNDLSDEDYNEALQFLSGMGDFDSALPMEIDAGDERHIRMDKRFFGTLILKDFPNNLPFDALHQYLTPVFTNERSSLTIKPTSIAKIKTVLNKNIVDIEAKIRRAESGKLDLSATEKEDLYTQKASLTNQLNNITGENHFYTLSLMQSLYEDNAKELNMLLTDKKNNARMDNVELDRGFDNILNSVVNTTGFNSNKINKHNFILNPDELTVFMPFTQNNKLDGGQIVGLDVNSYNNGKYSPIQHPMFKAVKEGSINFENENTLVSGATGTGKTYSSILRMFDMIDMGMRLCVLDSEGQFGGITKELGGIDIKFSPDSAFPINFLEVSEEPAIDDNGDIVTGKFIVMLNRHYTKVYSLFNDLYKYANQNTPMTSSQTNIIMFLSKYLFQVIRGINNDVESLYTINEKGEEERINMPQISEYVEFIRLFERGHYFNSVKNQGGTLLAEEEQILGKVLYLLSKMEYDTFDDFFAEEGILPEDFKVLYASLKRYSSKHGGDLTNFDTQTNKDSQLYQWHKVPIINLNIKKLIEASGGADEFTSNFIIKVLATWLRQDFYNKHLSLKKGLIIDECWRYMQRKSPWQDAVYDEMLEAAKTIRKRNGLLWLITQSLTEFNTDEGKGLLQNIQHRIILAPGKEEENIRAAKGVGLTSPMINELNTLLRNKVKGFSYMQLGGDWYFIQSSPSEAESKLIKESYLAVEQQ